MTSRPTNTDISELLRDVAAAYQLSDEKKYRFQIIAYQRAADAVEHATSELYDLWENDELTDIPGVGKSISEHLSELFEKGASTHFESLLEKIPKAVFVLMKVPGIGPKKAFRLATEFNLSEKKALDEAEAAGKAGKIAELSGFGVESEKAILQGIAEYRIKPPERMLISTATEVSNEILEWMKGSPEIISIDPLGSLRRKTATIGDLDFSVATDNPEAVFDRFVAFPQVARVIERGDHGTSVLLHGNIHVDLMVQPKGAYGSLLQHFTGSKHHNVALREYALKKGLSLSEYGIKSLNNEHVPGGKFNTELNLYQFDDEKTFYKALGLNWVAPELREDTGEIEAAIHSFNKESGGLPNLVELSDIRGDLQMHTNFDIETSHDIGASSMQELVETALSRGYEYIAFTDHNPSQKGHDVNSTNSVISRRSDTIAQLNESLVKTLKGRVFKVFNSLEIDILPNGNLPVNDAGLDLLDFALVSIHSSFKLERAEMTKRVISALSHPKVKIFAHPTGRLLNERESVSLDWDQIFDFCIKNKKAIEINADPHRLDLPDMLVREGKKYGVKFSLGTDAHQAGGLSNMPYGVFVARRGWLSASDIINTRSLKEFEKEVI